MRPRAAAAPRPPRPQQPVPAPAAQHPLPRVPPRPQNPPTRRTAQQPADQLNLHQHQLGAYDQHRVPPPASRESPPDATTKLAGGLSRVHERAKPANPVTTTNGTIPPAGDQNQRRSTKPRAPARGT